MIDELLDLLAKEMAMEPAEFPCPQPARLSSVARGAAAGIDVTELARHLTCCISCAKRWEILQQDACIGAGEALAFLRLGASDFARVRAESHARSCNRCSKIVAALGKVDGLTGNAMRPDAFIVPVKLIALARRSAPHEEISAAVLETNGTPRISEDQILHQRVAVLESAVRDGVLSIKLQTGEEFASANLAILPLEDADSEFPVFLPDAEVVNGIASWRVQTTAQEGSVPVRSLAVTLITRTTV